MDDEKLTDEKSARTESPEGGSKGTGTLHRERMSLLDEIESHLNTHTDDDLAEVSSNDSESAAEAPAGSDNNVDQPKTPLSRHISLVAIEALKASDGQPDISDRETEGAAAPPTLPYGVTPQTTLHEAADDADSSIGSIDELDMEYENSDTESAQDDVEGCSSDRMSDFTGTSPGDELSGGYLNADDVLSDGLSSPEVEWVDDDEDDEDDYEQRGMFLNQNLLVSELEVIEEESSELLALESPYITRRAVLSRHDATDTDESTPVASSDSDSDLDDSLPVSSSASFTQTVQTISLARSIFEKYKQRKSPDSGSHEHQYGNPDMKNPVPEILITTEDQLDIQHESPDRQDETHKSAELPAYHAYDGRQESIDDSPFLPGPNSHIVNSYTVSCPNLVQSSSTPGKAQISIPPPSDSVFEEHPEADGLIMYEIVNDEPYDEVEAASFLTPPSSQDNSRHSSSSSEEGGDPADVHDIKATKQEMELSDEDDYYVLESPFDRAPIESSASEPLIKSDDEEINELRRRHQAINSSLDEIVNVNLRKTRVFQERQNSLEQLMRDSAEIEDMHKTAEELFGPMPGSSPNPPTPDSLCESTDRSEDGIEVDDGLVMSVTDLLQADHKDSTDTKFEQSLVGPEPTVDYDSEMVMDVSYEKMLPAEEFVFSSGNFVRSNSAAPCCDQPSGLTVSITGSDQRTDQSHSNYGEITEKTLANKMLSPREYMYGTEELVQPDPPINKQKDGDVRLPEPLMDEKGYLSEDSGESEHLPEKFVTEEYMHATDDLAEPNQSSREKDMNVEKTQTQTHDSDDKLVTQNHDDISSDSSASYTSSSSMVSDFHSDNDGTPRKGEFASKRTKCRKYRLHGTQTQSDESTTSSSGLSDSEDIDDLNEDIPEKEKLRAISSISSTLRETIDFISKDTLERKRSIEIMESQIAAVRDSHEPHDSASASDSSWGEDSSSEDVVLKECSPSETPTKDFSNRDQGDHAENRFTASKEAEDQKNTENDRNIEEFIARVSMEPASSVKDEPARLAVHTRKVPPVIHRSLSSELLERARSLYSSNPSLVPDLQLSPISSVHSDSEDSELDEIHAMTSDGEDCHSEITDFGRNCPSALSSSSWTHNPRSSDSSSCARKVGSRKMSNSSERSLTPIQLPRSRSNNGRHSASSNSTATELSQSLSKLTTELSDDVGPISVSEVKEIVEHEAEIRPTSFQITRSERKMSYASSLGDSTVEDESENELPQIETLNTDYDTSQWKPSETEIILEESFIDELTVGKSDISSNALLAEGKDDSKVHSAWQVSSSDSSVTSSSDNEEDNWVGVEALPTQEIILHAEDLQRPDMLVSPKSRSGSWARSNIRQLLVDQNFDELRLLPPIIQISQNIVQVLQSEDLTMDSDGESVMLDRVLAYMEQREREKMLVKQTESLKRGFQIDLDSESESEVLSRVEKVMLEKMLYKIQSMKRTQSPPFTSQTFEDEKLNGLLDLQLTETESSSEEGSLTPEPPRQTKRDSNSSSTSGSDGDSSEDDEEECSSNNQTNPTPSNSKINLTGNVFPTPPPVPQHHTPPAKPLNLNQPHRTSINLTGQLDSNVSGVQSEILYPRSHNSVIPLKGSSTAANGNSPQPTASLASTKKPANIGERMRDFLQRALSDRAENARPDQQVKVQFSSSESDTEQESGTEKASETESESESDSHGIENDSLLNRLMGRFPDPTKATKAKPVKSNGSVESESSTEESDSSSNSQSGLVMNADDDEMKRVKTTPAYLLRMQELLDRSQRLRNSRGKEDQRKERENLQQNATKQPLAPTSLPKPPINRTIHGHKVAIIEPKTDSCKPATKADGYTIQYIHKPGAKPPLESPKQMPNINKPIFTKSKRPVENGTAQQAMNADVIIQKYMLRSLSEPGNIASATMTSTDSNLSAPGRSRRNEQTVKSIHHDFSLQELPPVEHQPIRDNTNTTGRSRRNEQTVKSIHHDFSLQELPPVEHQPIRDNTNTTKESVDRETLHIHVLPAACERSESNEKIKKSGAALRREKRLSTHQKKPQVKQIQENKKSSGGQSGYSSSSQKQYYIDQNASSLSRRPQSEYGGTRKHQSRSPERYMSSSMSDYGTAPRRMSQHDSRQYETLRSDVSGDWQFYGPDDVPGPRPRSMSLKRQPKEPAFRSSQSDYYGHTSSRRAPDSSSHSDYYGPTTSMRRSHSKGTLGDLQRAGSTNSLKIVRKQSVPRNGYVSSSDDSYEGANYVHQSMTLPSKNKNSTLKRTIKRTVTRRADQSPVRHEEQRIVVRETEAPRSPERISVFLKEREDEEDKKSLRRRSMSLPREPSNKRVPGKIHTIQTLTREESNKLASNTSKPKPITNNQQVKTTTKTEQYSIPQPVVATGQARFTKKVSSTSQQNLAPIAHHGNTTITFSGPPKVQREETYVNKVFQQNDTEAPKRPESFASGVIQVDDTPVRRAPVQQTPPTPTPSDVHLTRINIHNIEPVSPPDKHHTTINLQHAPIPQVPVRLNEVIPYQNAPNYNSPPPQLNAEQPIVPSQKKPVHSAPAGKPKGKPKGRMVVEEYTVEESDGETPYESITPQRSPNVEAPIQKAKKPPPIEKQPEILAPVRSAPVEKPKKKKNKKKNREEEEYIEEIYIQKAESSPSESEEETKTKKTTKKTIVRYVEAPKKAKKKEKPKEEDVEEITETTIHHIFEDMSPDRQKTFSELTKTALGRTEQTASNLFSGGNKSLITEAWHTDKPKTEQEIIEELSTKTTSEVVKKSLLEGLDYNFVPTHSRELEEIQRKRKEFEAELERQRKIREIKAGIRQNIHVDHNEETLHGDYSMSLTDDGQIDMDTVEEHVDLGINESGVAAIAVKVTAERLLPVDVDKQIWRKSSVTVTRTIEIDLMKCGETRRIYEKILNAHKVMLNARAEEAARHGQPIQSVTQELNAADTYRIFSTLMNATGEGGEDLGILNSEGVGVLSGVAAKHFLSGNYIRDPKEKERAFAINGNTSNSSPRESQRSSETKTTRTVKQESLSSFDPELVRGERTSEYYKQKLRNPSPPPDFSSRMFGGKDIQPQFSSDLEDQQVTRSEVHVQERSISPVRHQHQFLEDLARQRQAKSPERRIRIHDPRNDVISGSSADLSSRGYDREPSQDRAIEEYHYKQEYTTSADTRDGDPKLRSIRPTGAQLLYTERVSGVKQKANDEQRRQDAERSLHRHQARRHTPSHDELLFSDSERRLSQPPRDAGRNESKHVREERRYSSSKRQPDVHDSRAVMGINGDRQTRGYESGYYSEQGNGSALPVKSDINRMLTDAENYFRKTSSEHELNKINDEYRANHPRVNKDIIHVGEPPEYDGDFRGSASTMVHTTKTTSHRAEEGQHASNQRVPSPDYPRQDESYDVRSSAERDFDLERGVKIDPEMDGNNSFERRQAYRSSLYKRVNEPIVRQTETREEQPDRLVKMDMHFDDDHQDSGVRKRDGRYDSGANKREGQYEHEMNRLEERYESGANRGDGRYGDRSERRDGRYDARGNRKEIRYESRDTDRQHGHPRHGRGSSSMSRTSYTSGTRNSGSDDGLNHGLYSSRQMMLGSR